MELAGQTASRKQISNSGLAITLTDLWRSIYQCPKREKDFPAISREKGNDNLASWQCIVQACHSYMYVFSTIRNVRCCKTLLVSTRRARCQYCAGVGNGNYEAENRLWQREIPEVAKQCSSLIFKIGRVPNYVS